MGKTKLKYYLVTAYRWGEREAHSYFVGMYDKKHRAIKNAEAEADLRGGKYSCLVEEISMNTDTSLKVSSKCKSIYLAKGRILNGTNLI